MQKIGIKELIIILKTSEENQEIMELDYWQDKIKDYLQTFYLIGKYWNTRIDDKEEKYRKEILY